MNRWHRNKKMDKANMNPQDSGEKRLPRRTALQVLLSAAFMSSATLATRVMAQAANGNTSVPSASVAQAWRAMSRVGYGPSPALVRAMQAAPSARVWALQQLDLAFAASQLPPHIAADLADFNQPLQQIFDGVKRERQERAVEKADVQKAADTAADRNSDFFGPREARYFSRDMLRQASAWRLASCSEPDQENPLLARMTEFWFNHLNVYAGKGAVRPFVGHYVVNVARAHALGKFEDLLLASARHPAMLLYLDQAQSVADGTTGPNGKIRGLNENYARELMELHTLGVNGGYTQTDVRELARVLTGWTVGPNEASGFRFALRLHDRGSKKVLGRTYPSGFSASGESEGEEAIRMLARHPKTATHISLRLAQFFVADSPPDALVQRLSHTFLTSQGDIHAVMRALLESSEFWQADHRLFKTPMDFACSALAATQGAQERKNLVLAMSFLAGAGQPLHGWQTPDGYKVDAATWLAPEALTRRADFALSVARNHGDMDFLTAYLSPVTLAAIDRERPALRAGLMLASPDFMYK